MDKIAISAIPLSVRIGVSVEERSQPQTVLLDLTLEIDLDAAANTDDLGLTVDYLALVSKLKQVAESGECRLLETLTGRLCSLALSDPRIVTAHARVRKFPVEMRGLAESVAVEMTRRSN